MSDASQLPAEVRESAMRSISAAGLPAAIERQAAAGERLGAVITTSDRCYVACCMLKAFTCC
jgi:hypothetical protein